jgi:hypothetical protein
MIQAELKAGTNYYITYIDTSRYAKDVEYWLWSIKSNETNATINMIPLSVGSESASILRLDAFIWGTTNVAASHSPSLGVIYIGSGLGGIHPYGYYDLTIYKNSSAANTNPSGLTVLYQGMINFYPNAAREGLTYAAYGNGAESATYITAV